MRREENQNAQLKHNTTLENQNHRVRIQVGSLQTVTRLDQDYWSVSEV